MPTNHSDVWNTAEKHTQKFECSCPASAVEMVLKFHGLVPEGFYDIQDAYQTADVGFLPFANKTIHRLKFTEHNDQPPFNKLRETIAAESAAGRCVVVSTRNPDGNFHIWLTTEAIENDFRAVSKSFEQSIECDLFREQLTPRPHGHFLTYTIEPEAP